MIGSARNFICDPDWAIKTQQGREDEIRRCIGCLYCIESFINNAMVGKPGECALNHAIGREREYDSVKRDGEGKRAVVVGAGPAGLTAAIELRRRGFDVTVLEKSKKAGGQVATAAKGPHKDKLYWAIEDMLTEFGKLGGRVEYSVTADERTVGALKPDVIILATGAAPIKPRRIPGVDRSNVYLAPDVLDGKATLSGGTVYVVGSGLTGLETAEALALSGCEVTVLEAADTVAPKAWFQHVDDSLTRLDKLGVKILTGSPLIRINEKSLVFGSPDGMNREELCDAVVLSMGVRPVKDLLDDMQNVTPNVFVIGDAHDGGCIGKATRDAYRAASKAK